MSLPSLFATLFAQATNTAAAVSTGTVTGDGSTPAHAAGLDQFHLHRPDRDDGLLSPCFVRSSRPRRKPRRRSRRAKTGDKVVTTSGIHGVITNMKETTVILKIADNVKIEIEKSSIDKITRPDNGSGSEKTAAAKA